MNLSLQEDLSSRETNTLLFQPVFLGSEESYIVYLAPVGEEDGRFVQEEGGVVWFSTNHPEGELCETRLIPKALGDIILDKTRPQPERVVREIERI